MILKSTPIVARCFYVNSSVAYRVSSEVFPTPESPINTILVIKVLSILFCFILLMRVFLDIDYDIQIMISDIYNSLNMKSDMQYLVYSALNFAYIGIYIWGPGTICKVRFNKTVLLPFQVFFFIRRNLSIFLISWFFERYWFWTLLATSFNRYPILWQTEMSSHILIDNKNIYQKLLNLIVVSPFFIL